MNKETLGTKDQWNQRTMDPILYRQGHNGANEKDKHSLESSETEKQKILAKTHLVRAKASRLQKLKIPSYEKE